MTHGDGWIPIGKKPEELAPLVNDYRARAAAAGKAEPEVVTFSQLNVDDPGEAQATVAAFAEAGVSRLVWLCRYDSVDYCLRALDKLQAVIDQQG